jgi:hypothetical protein
MCGVMTTMRIYTTWRTTLTPKSTTYCYRAFAYDGWGPQQAEARIMLYFLGLFPSGPILPWPMASFAQPRLTRDG